LASKKCQRAQHLNQRKIRRFSPAVDSLQRLGEIQRKAVISTIESGKLIARKIRGESPQVATRGLLIHE
jgi:hypothetical protein